MTTQYYKCLAVQLRHDLLRHDLSEASPPPMQLCYVLALDYGVSIAHLNHWALFSIVYSAN